MLDYFHLYGFKPSFNIPPDELRSRYLQIQRDWHPDFFVNDHLKYTEALSKTSMNNQAYKALGSFPSVVDYVLREYDLLNEGEKNVLPSAFLGEMLDLNDLIGEAAMGDKDSKTKADETLSDFEQNNLVALRNTAARLDALEKWDMELLNPLKTLYQQYRYLNRLRKNLNGIQEF